ncbi:MAG: SCP2 sterol-binding domain-containing protein, partial [Deltaproteobacteria bacterium]|nr:SCP2 sterol-binding domain-containing protein [Deltaproteobacteria bacterium]
MATVKEIFMRQLPAKLQAKPEVCKSVGAVVEFQLSGEGGGTWTLDCPAGGTIKEGGAEKPQVTVIMDAADFVAMMGGGLNPQKAFLTGKLKVKGEMGVALKL